MSNTPHAFTIGGPPIRQIIPSSVCMACDICCRYQEPATTFVPTFLRHEVERLTAQPASQPHFPSIGFLYDHKPPPVKGEGCHICSFFDQRTNGCTIYADRPLDCQLYPFQVSYTKDYRAVELVLDVHCPVFRDTPDRDIPAFREHVAYLADLLDQDAFVDAALRQPDFISAHHPLAVPLAPLPALSRRLGLDGLGLTRLSLADRDHVNDAFADAGHPLGCFHFAYVYAMSGVLNLLWKELNGALCLFAGKHRDYFLLMPPLERDGGPPSRRAVREAMETLAALNGEAPTSVGSDAGSTAPTGTDSVPPRIECVPGAWTAALADAGLTLQPSEQEYVYDLRRLAAHVGDDYKSKRRDINRFLARHPDHTIRPFAASDAVDCLRAYRDWASHKLSTGNGSRASGAGQVAEDSGSDASSAARRGAPNDGERSAPNSQSLAALMIEDSYFAHKAALFNSEALGLEGVVAEVDGRLRGYSVGYAQWPDTFVNLFEATDLQIAGLAQTLFKELAVRLPRHSVINTLDDAGSSTLRAAKLSYRPARLLPRHTAVRCTDV